MGPSIGWLLQKFPFSHHQGYRVSKCYLGKKQKKKTPDISFMFGSFVVNLPRLKLFLGHLLQTVTSCCSVQSFRTFLPFSRAGDLSMYIILPSNKVELGSAGFLKQDFRSSASSKVRNSAVRWVLLCCALSFDTICLSGRWLVVTHSVLSSIWDTPLFLPCRTNCVK